MPPIFSTLERIHLVFSGDRLVTQLVIFLLVPSEFMINKESETS